MGDLGRTVQGSTEQSPLFPIDPLAQSLLCGFASFYTGFICKRRKKSVIYLPTLAGDATQDFPEQNGGVGRHL